MTDATSPPDLSPHAAPAAGSNAVRGLWSFTGKYRILHLTWIAFFLSFVVWFNYAPFANTIAAQLGLSDAEKKTIALCNVALTIPARIFIGMALDRWGPRRVYAAILMFAVIPNTIFALSSSFSTLVLSRLALVGGRRRIRGGHPHGVGMVPAERGRHGRRGVRRLGQLRRGGRRVLAPAARRVVRWRRRVALVDPAHRHHRRRLRRRTTSRPSPTPRKASATCVRVVRVRSR